MNVVGRPVACDECERPFPQQETLCPVCDSPNPNTRSFRALSPECTVEFYPAPCFDPHSPFRPRS